MADHDTHDHTGVPGVGGGLTTIRGIVDDDGSILQGTGFTVTPNATGDYTIDFDTPFAATPLVLAQAVSPNDSDVRNLFLMVVSTTEVHLLTTTFPGVNVDAVFSFIAIAF